MSKKKKWLVFGGGGAIIMILIVSMNLKGIPVDSDTVGNASINEYVEERAMTVLPHTVRICMPFDGRILPIALKPDTPVKKGDIVAQMDTFPLKLDIAKTTADVEACKGRIGVNKFNQMEETALVECKKWMATMKELEKVSQQRVKASESAAKFAGEHRDSLVASGAAVSKIEVSEAKMEAAVAAVKVESDKAMLNVAKIMTSISNMTPVYINDYLERKKLETGVLKSQLSAGESGMKQAEKNLKRAVMTTPIDGVVLKRCFENERMLSAGELLLEIGDLKTLEVNANILSDDAIAIQPGNKVEIYGPGLRGKSVTGKVKRVDPKGFTEISSLGVKQQRVKVVVEFDEGVLDTLKSSGTELGVEYRVHVKIITASKPDTLVIPRTALFKGKGNSWQVFKISLFSAELTDVKVGLMNDNQVEILSGLKKGDRVVNAPPSSLANGDFISVK